MLYVSLSLCLPSFFLRPLPLSISISPFSKVGLDTEMSELIEGSDIFMPKIEFDQVILPRETKNLILQTIGSFDKFRKTGIAVTTKLSLSLSLFSLSISFIHVSFCSSPYYSERDWS
jgi:hypothetical protein